MSDGVRRPGMLARLDAEIESARSRLDADLRRAERAAYLSRLGRHTDARGELDALRARYASGPDVAISSWIHLAEGLLCHFSDMSPSAREKILRAHALSSAANSSRVCALSAAWLAHMDYLQANFHSMARYASEAVVLSNDQDHATRSRVSLVIADAFHLAGRLDLALPWYGKSRNHASAEGDEATLSALMHNMAWLRAQRVRAADCGLAEAPTASEQHALLGAESTANFDVLIGSTSWTALVPILRAQILTSQKQYAEALVLFELEKASPLNGGMSRLTADLMADKAWCRAQLGQHEAALQDAFAGEASINPDGQFDDRALAHGRLAQTFSLLGQSTDAQRNRVVAEQAWAAHVSLQGEILALLSRPPLARGKA